MFRNTDEKILQAIVQDILSYMRYLRDQLGYEVSVHQIDAFAAGFMKGLSSFNNHECFYCRYMKSNTDIAMKCVEHQIALCDKIGTEPFFGTCWLGVGEYVFPLFDRDRTVVGFISVSGYRGEAEKTRAQTRKVCERYGLNRSETEYMQASLKEEIPPFEAVKQVVEPLKYMFMLFQQYMERFAVYFVGADLGSTALFGRINSYLRNHLNQNISEAELAKEFSVSESTLSRMFRAFTQSGYRGYMNTLRCTVGKVYLESSDISIRELADLLGYADANYFSTVFRKQCGISPEGFRKKSKNALKRSIPQDHQNKDGEE